MSVKIRLARFGRNKTPFYHIVATDSRNRRDSKFLEKLGTFNPLLPNDSKEKIILKKDRVEYWLSVGALPSDRVALLMIKMGVKDAEKYKPVFIAKEKQVKESKKGAKAAAPAAAAPAAEAKAEEPAKAPEAKPEAAPVVQEEPKAPEVKVEAPVVVAEEPKPAAEEKVAETIAPAVEQ
jgi:small subunit ribosomal protein S16